MSDIEQRVKRIVMQRLEKTESEVTGTASFVDDLGADSLDTVQLVMDFEDEFDIEIQDDQAAKIVNVQDAINHISAHFAGQSE